MLEACIHRQLREVHLRMPIEGNRLKREEGLNGILAGIERKVQPIPQEVVVGLRSMSIRLDLVTAADPLRCLEEFHLPTVAKKVTTKTLSPTVLFTQIIQTTFFELSCKCCAMLVS